MGNEQSLSYELIRNHNDFRDYEYEHAWIEYHGSRTEPWQRWNQPIQDGKQTNLYKNLRREKYEKGYAVQVGYLAKDHGGLFGTKETGPGRAENGETCAWNVR